MKMKFRLDKRENSAKKRRRCPDEAPDSFCQGEKTACDHGDGSDYSIDNDDCNSEAETEPVYYDLYLL